MSEALKPSEMSDGEKILGVFHQHWMVLVKSLFVAGIAFTVAGLCSLEVWYPWQEYGLWIVAALPTIMFIFSLFMAKRRPGIIAGKAPMLRAFLLMAVAITAAVMGTIDGWRPLLATSLWYVAAVPGIYFLYKLMSWRSNVWVVTNKRVVSKEGVIMTSSKDSPLGKINNTSISQGLMGRILDYGNITIQTAAEMGATPEPSIGDVDGLKACILKAQEEATKGGE